MRAPSYFAAFATVVACGNASKPNVTFHVDPPPEGDSSCIGVAGFDVTVSVSTTSQKSESGPLLNREPVLAASACHLKQSFSLQDVDVDSPADIAVTGRDGAGQVRVEARGHVDNLHGGPVHVQLQGPKMPPDPVLVVNRLQLLGGGLLSDIALLTITTTKAGRLNLVTVAPGDYFSVEPGAYGVPVNLAANGTDAGQMITADITMKAGPTQRIKLNLVWVPTGAYYQASQ